MLPFVGGMFELSWWVVIGLFRSRASVRISTKLAMHSNLKIPWGVDSDQLWGQTESLKIFRFLLDFWESWRLSRVRNGVGI